MALGDFTASKLPQLILGVEEIWEGALVNSEPLEKYDTTVMDVLYRADTSSMEEIVTSKTGICQGVKIAWIDDDDYDANIEEDEYPQFEVCDFEGQTVTSDSTTYNEWHRVWTTCEVRDWECDNLFMKNEKLFHSMARAHRRIVKKIVAYGLSKLHSFAGPNLFNGVTDIAQIGRADGTVTEIAPGNFNYYDFIPYMERMRAYNKYGSLLWLDGGIFHKAMITAQIQAGTFGDTGQNNGLKMLKNMYEAMPSFIDAGIGTGTMYAVRPGSVAVAHYNKHGEGNVPIQANSVYRVKSRMPLQGLKRRGETIWLDVSYKPEERPVVVDGVPTGKCELYHVFLLETWVEIFNNPTYDSGRTGVLEFVADPTKTKVTNNQFPEFVA